MLDVSQRTQVPAPAVTTTIAASENAQPIVNSKNFLLSMLALVVSLCFIAVFLEVGVRIAFHEKKEYSIEMWRYAKELKSVAKDPRVGHEHVPRKSGRFMGVEVSINSHKLREREIGFEKAPGVKRILMLGDSVTLGWGVPFEKTTSKQLEALLNTSNRPQKYEVINTGVGNYNTQMEVQYFFNEGMKYSPDMVILNYFINDAEEIPRYGGNFFNENLQSWVYFSGRLDTLLRLWGKGKGWDTYYADLYRDDAPGWQQTRLSVTRLGNYCLSTGIPCLFVNYPELRKVKDYPFRHINVKLEALARSTGIEYFDLLPSVIDAAEETLWVTVPDPHPNALANTYFATALHAHVRGRI
jgi:GDSL-like Lipase/Acylhydrolase family